MLVVALLSVGTFVAGFIVDATQDFMGTTGKAMGMLGMGLLTVSVVSMGLYAIAKS